MKKKLLKILKLANLSFLESNKFKLLTLSCSTLVQKPLKIYKVENLSSFAFKYT